MKYAKTITTFSAALVASTSFAYAAPKRAECTGEWTFKKMINACYTGANGPSSEGSESSHRNLGARAEAPAKPDVAPSKPEVPTLLEFLGTATQTVSGTGEPQSPGKNEGHGHKGDPQSPGKNEGHGHKGEPQSPGKNEGHGHKGEPQSPGSVTWGVVPNEPAPPSEGKPNEVPTVGEYLDNARAKAAEDKEKIDKHDRNLRYSDEEGRRYKGEVKSYEGNYGTGNKGYTNTGDYNTGRGNFGDHNVGDKNYGSYNQGAENHGDGNHGNQNYGNGNVGNGNFGDDNRGNDNIGDRNVGNGNVGDDNNGNNNFGSGNTGDGNIGDAPGYSSPGELATERLS